MNHPFKWENTENTVASCPGVNFGPRGRFAALGPITIARGKIETPRLDVGLGPEQLGMRNKIKGTISTDSPQNPINIVNDAQPCLPLFPGMALHPEHCKGHG